MPVLAYFENVPFKYDVATFLATFGTIGILIGLKIWTHWRPLHRREENSIIPKVDDAGQTGSRSPFQNFQVLEQVFLVEMKFYSLWIFVVDAYSTLVLRIILPTYMPWLGSVDNLNI